ANIFLDGSYAASIESAGIKDISFALAPTASIGNVVSEKRGFDAQKYFPVDIAAQQMAKSFVQTKTSINPGFSDVKNTPMFVTSGTGSADVGLIREGQGDWALEVDEYLARSPFDGLLTEIHCTVPGGAPYTKAWVLAAVDPDPAKDATLTTRVTRYLNGGIGENLIADTTIQLPRGNEKPTAGVMAVGTVSGVDQEGRKINLPLYLVEVPLDSGKILDLYANSSLDFEFLGKLDRNMQQRDFSMKPDPKSTSAVQVFGATLEKSPIGMDIVQSQPGNVFAEGETRETGLTLKSFAPAQGTLNWEIFDADDKKASSGTAEYSFTKSGEEKKVTIPLQMKELGWYRLLLSARDQKGNELFMHKASFALLGKDSRQAKYDSPYATWWWDGSHNTTKNVEFDGPLMFKAGIRKASWTSRSEEELAKWFITRPQHSNLFSSRDLSDPETALKNHEAILRAAVEKYPHTREVLIFHESGPGSDVPTELLSNKPEAPIPGQVAYEKSYADVVNLAGPFFREKFPQLKLVVGNSGTAQATIAAVLRNGGNPDFIDYVGIEATGQSFIPEKISEVSIPGSHMTTDIAKVLSGRVIPATGCLEFVSRSQRDLGAEQHAQWYMRDVLISLSNGFTTISPGTLSDASNAYYNTYWGSGGMLERTPYGYPKKAYVAYAALTNVLDQVSLRRQVPTGSTTVYAIEFDRADKKLATALWASRGDADFNLIFSGDTAVTVVEMYGRKSELKTAGGKLTVRAGVSPVYLVADKEITAITLSNRAFPEDEARAKLATVAAAFNSTNDVMLDKDNRLDAPKAHPLIIPVRQLGDFNIRQVKDEQKGDVLELELNTSKNPGLSKYITEYATLRLNTPATVSGEPAALGVWVKGNSNWGRALFEIEDAQGEVWRSTGTSGWGCDIVDWPGHLSVNFDGWNFLALPLRDSTLFHDDSPGPLLEQWVSSGGDKQIEYPIKLRALIIEMNRTPLDLIDFKAANPVIRLKDAGGIYES
ncbi:MAG: hypothetical protein ABI210_04235, partial [Abditibacteriaceae bacterium]